MQPNQQSNNLQDNQQSNTQLQLQSQTRSQGINQQETAPAITAPVLQPRVQSDGNRLRRADSSNMLDHARELQRLTNDQKQQIAQMQSLPDFGRQNTGSSNGATNVNLPGQYQGMIEQQQQPVQLQRNMSASSGPQQPNQQMGHAVQEQILLEQLKQMQQANQMFSNNNIQYAQNAQVAQIQHQQQPETQAKEESPAAQMQNPVLNQQQSQSQNASTEQNNMPQNLDPNKLVHYLEEFQRVCQQIDQQYEQPQQQIQQHNNIPQQPAQQLMQAKPEQKAQQQVVQAQQVPDQSQQHQEQQNQAHSRQPEQISLQQQVSESIHKYTFQGRINSIAFQNGSESDITLAIGSLNMEQQNNKVEILQLMEATTTSNEQPQQPQTTQRLVKLFDFPHEYPPSKIMWAPESSARKDFLATSGEFVKIWLVADRQGKLLWDVRQEVNAEHQSPVTSFDWNCDKPNMLATTQLNGICSVWDLHSMQIMQQLIAHDGQVNAISFTSDTNTFATGGEDGQVRIFDLRNLQTSTIIYQSTNPILQVLWNRTNTHQLALVLGNSSDVIILDQRYAMAPQTTLLHQSQVNCATWYPSQNVLSTACDDSVTKIYDLNDASIGENALWSQPFQEAKFKYQADSPINQISWSNTSPKKWLGITLDSQVQLLKF